MEHHVAVGVADHALRVRHCHPAQHEVVAGAEAVDVEAHADAGLQGLRGCDGVAILRRENALGPSEILLGGDLQVVLVAGGEGDGEAGLLRHRGIVGQSIAGRSAVSVENRQDSESLAGSGRARALRAPPRPQSRRYPAPPA